ncbi:MAG: 2-C-methyl-D-erythritol 4-phosphate cytidylyltransferase [Gammaproteobacteria bacterium]|nr:2-C-methyl-D-erythritol 4-phosphate cytidylyltransferase [Gammaproteobacteria bacterium]
MIEAAAFWAVIPAAGAGRRIGGAIPKQYLPLAGKLVIEHALACFIEYAKIAGIVVAVDSNDDRWPSLKIASAKPLVTVIGGRERCHSVLNALEHLKNVTREDAWVLVHDAARPCLHADDLDKLMTTLADDPVGGILAAPVRDTLKRADRENRIDQTVERTALWHALTPQMFRLSVLHAALQAAIEADVAVTDEAAAVERAGLRPRLVEGRGDNIKITHPQDLALAERILAVRVLC